MIFMHQSDVIYNAIRKQHINKCKTQNLYCCPLSWTRLFASRASILFQDGISLSQGKKREASAFDISVKMKIIWQSALLFGLSAAYPQCPLQPKCTSEEQLCFSPPPLKPVTGNGVPPCPPIGQCMPKDGERLSVLAKWKVTSLKAI